MGSPYVNGYLLDTHVLIWLMVGDKTLSAKTRSLIDSATTNSMLAISAMTAWEIAMLEAKEKITLTQPCLDWIHSAIDLAGLEYIDLSPEIAVDSCQLPDHFHDDPAGRIIVSTARLNNLTLLTRDQRILDYSKKHFLKAIKV